MILSWKELRAIKDNLPDGAIHQIATKLDMHDDAVRNFFGGTHYTEGIPNDVHFERGRNGGYVRVENAQILDEAISILGEAKADELLGNP